MGIEKIYSLLEKNAFGVCSYFGKKWGVPVSKIRLSFIYLTFLTLGSPIVIYFVFALVLDYKDFIFPKNKRKSIWDIE